MEKLLYKRKEDAEEGTDRENLELKPLIEEAILPNKANFNG